MKQREIQDRQNVRWQCVQALAGLGESAVQATEYIEKSGGKVPVICTPSGGAQTVRLHLDQHWNEQMSDDELINAIAQAQQRQ